MILICIFDYLHFILIKFIIKVVHYMSKCSVTLHVTCNKYKKIKIY